MAGSKRVVALVARPKAAAVRSSARVQAVPMAVAAWASVRLRRDLVEGSVAVGAAAWWVVAGLVIRLAAMALRRVVSLIPVSRAVAAMGWPSSSRRWHCADVSTLSTAEPRTARGW